MALDTLRANKMRSALTVLGIVIGITSIVGMTSLIRGFDESLRDSINVARAEDDLRASSSARISLSSGASFLDLMRRPEPHGRRRRGDRAAGADRSRWSTSGSAPAPPQPTMERVFYRGERTQAGADHRHERALRRRELREDRRRPRLHRAGGAAPARASWSSATDRTRRCSSSSGIDPIGKKVRLGAVEYTVVGVIGKRPGAGGFGLGQDDFVIIPYTTYRKQFGSETRRAPGRSAARGAMIAVVPHECGDARGRDARGRGDHAHPPRPDARQAERLRPRHAGRHPRSLGSDLAGRSCCRWSSSRRSR